MIYNPTLLHIPHASTLIPAAWQAGFASEKLPHELAVMTDWFCDSLFACSRQQLMFPVSRLVCDVERFRDDSQEVMAALGMGFAYESCSDLSPLRHLSPEQKKRILSELYDPHHKAFTAAVAARLAVFGRCRILDAHSFYPAPLPYELNQSPVRPDFCIGADDYHTPPRLVAALCSYLKEQGFSVAFNAPFCGTIVPMDFYQHDRRVTSVMIEVNRALYLSAPGVKSASFDAINRILRRCVEIIEEES